MNIKRGFQGIIDKVAEIIKDYLPRPKEEKKWASDIAKTYFAQKKPPAPPVLVLYNSKQGMLKVVIKEISARASQLEKTVQVIDANKLPEKLERPENYLIVIKDPHKQLIGGNNHAKIRDRIGPHYAVDVEEMLKLYHTSRQQPAVYQKRA